MENIITLSGKFINRIIDYVYSLCEDTSIYQTEIKIPGDILYRTELMCNYISKAEDLSMNLDSFMKILYYRFIRECVDKYAPDKVYKMLSTQYFKDDSIIISNGTDKCVIHRSIEHIYTISIQLPREDADAGELILREIYELYKYKFSFKTLLEQLWLSFINDYKTGNNKKAIHTLKVELEEYLSRNYTD